MELREGSYECCVCYDAVHARDPIWACDTCYRVLHTHCVRTWREKSVSTAASSASGAVHIGSSAPWRCPGCQAVQSHIPGNTCFCHKVKAPDLDPYLTPHSCGQVCGKRRGHGCPHPCEAVCHPGPCNPCSAMGPVRYCGCGRTSYRNRCGQSDGGNASQSSCGEVCGKPLSCGIKAHRCTKVCHAGPCGPCERLVVQHCYCGRKAEPRLCTGIGGAGRAASSKYLRVGDSGGAGPGIAVVKRIPGSGSDSSDDDDGEGNHHHDGQGAGNGAAVSVAFPLQPGLYSAAGQVDNASATSSVSAVTGDSGSGVLLLLLAALDDCSDSPAVNGVVSTAASTMVVHAPPTRDRVARQAMQHIDDGSMDRLHTQQSGDTDDNGEHVIPILATSIARPVPSAGYYSCNAVCGAWLDCGLHRCTSSCHSGDCSGCPTLPVRATTCACGKTPAEACIGYTPRSTCLDPLPTCESTCSKVRPCGHACEAPCHNGPCPPCFVPAAVTCRCACSEAVLPCDVVYALAACGGNVQALLRNQHAASAAASKAARGAGGKAKVQQARAAWNGLDDDGNDRDGYSGTHAASTTPRAPPSPVATPDDDWLSLLPGPVPAALLDELRGYPVEAVSTLLRCSRACSKKLGCGRHKCARLCCPLSIKGDEFEVARAESMALLAGQIRARLGGLALPVPVPSASSTATAAPGAAGSLVPAATSSASPAVAIGSTAPSSAILVDDEPEGQGSGHNCKRSCGRPMACGRHHCDNTCHAGPCGECGHVDYDAPLSCACGRTRIAPPIRCGTKLPSCPHQCTVPRPCGHPHQAWHTCHIGPCPPCTMPTDRMCGSGHEMRTSIPCHVGIVTCTRRCNKTLPCGEHACPRQCHTGSCVSADQLALVEQGRDAVAGDAQALALQAVVDSKSQWAGAVIGVDEHSAAPAVDWSSLSAHACSDASAWDSQTAAVDAAASLSRDAVASARRTGVLDCKQLYQDVFTASVKASVAAGKLRVACGHRCGLKRDLCDHTCASACHPGQPCPAVPCNEIATVYCDCGRLAVQLPCMHGADRVGSDIELDLSARRVPCDDLCASAARARAFGEAIGAIGTATDGLAGGGGNGLTGGMEGLTLDNGDRLMVTAPGKLGYCPYPDALLLYGRDNAPLAEKTEKCIRDLLLHPERYTGSARSGAGIDLQPMGKPSRAFVHQLAEIYGVNSLSFGTEPRRYVRLSRRQAGDKTVNGPKLQGGVWRDDIAGSGAVNGPETPRSGVDASGWSGAAGPVGAKPQSSIGTALAPGVIILPSLTLVEACKVHAARLDRLSGKTSATAAAVRPAATPASSAVGAGWARLSTAPGVGSQPLSSQESSAASSGSGATAMHPTEPLLSAMDRNHVGTILHAYGLRRSTSEAAVKEILADAGGEAAAAFRMRRLDDHNAVLIFDTQGRAVRALDAFAAGTAKGLMAPFRLRYWGVGVAAAMGRGPMPTVHRPSPTAATAVPGRTVATSSFRDFGISSGLGTASINESSSVVAVARDLFVLRAGGSGSTGTQTDAAAQVADAGTSAGRWRGHGGQSHDHDVAQPQAGSSVRPETSQPQAASGADAARGDGSDW